MQQQNSLKDMYSIYNIQFYLLPSRELAIITDTVTKVPNTNKIKAVSYTHLDVYKRQP